MSENVITTIVLAIFASTGFWTFASNIYNSRSVKKNAERAALIALLHDRIYFLARTYIEDKNISTEEYKNLEALYIPYKDLGGNGTGKKLWEEVNRLPIKED